MEFNFLIFWLILIVIFGTIFLVYKIWEAGKRDIEVKRLLNTRVFLVTIPREIHQASEKEQPKDFRQFISIAEQMFTAFSGLYSHDLKNKFLAEQEQISFEIVTQANLISFYIVCPKMLEEMVVRQVQSYYPTAHLDPVQNPNIFALDGRKGEFAVASFKQNKKFILPIRTYLSLESDPLASITNAMSKMGENENAAFQMVIQPAGENWRAPAYAATKKVQEGKTSIGTTKWYMKAAQAFMEMLSSTAHSAAANKNTPPNLDKDAYKPMSPIQEALLKALNDKVSKNAFKVSMRIVTTAPQAIMAQTNLKNIASAFAQFGTPELNSFKVKMGDNLIVKDYILRRMTGKAMILTTEELATLYHLPNQYIETPNIRWLLAKEMAPPQNIPAEGVVMGKSAYRGVEKLIRIKPDDRRRHIFMIGKTGVGKTTLFTNMIEQDILSGAGCCFIDPLGDAVENILGKIPPHRQKDVILFDPSDTAFPLGLNMLEFKKPEDRDFLIQECIEIFYKLFDPNRTGMVGPQWEHWFRNAALTVMSQPASPAGGPGGGTLIDIPRIFTDDAFRKAVVGYVQDPIVKAFWEEQLAKTADFHKSEMYNYFISKFGRFLTNDLMRNIIGQKVSSFNFREAMDSGKIILINLSKGKIGEMNSALLGMILVARIQVAAFSRADTPEEQRRDFYLYVDEFQNFTTDTFKTILSEARKYHLNLNVTNQYIAQLTESVRDAVIGNAGTMIIYRIGAADAEFLVKEFPDVSVNDMTNLDAFNTYVKLLIDGTPSRPFSMKGIKSPIESNPQVRDQIKQFSRQTYGRPVERVNQEIGLSLSIGKNLPPAETGANEPIRNL